MVRAFTPIPIGNSHAHFPDVHGKRRGTSSTAACCTVAGVSGWGGRRLAVDEPEPEVLGALLGQDHVRLVGGAAVREVAAVAHVPGLFALGSVLALFEIKRGLFLFPRLAQRVIHLNAATAHPCANAPHHDFLLPRPAGERMQPWHECV